MGFGLMVQYSMEKRLWILVHVGHVSFVVYISQFRLQGQIDS